jgi:hypothetical protein
MQAQEVVPIETRISVSVVGTQPDPKPLRDVVIDASAGLKSETDVTVSTKAQKGSPKLNFGAIVYRHADKKVSPGYELRIFSKFKLRTCENRMDEVHLPRSEEQLMLVIAGYFRFDPEPIFHLSENEATNPLRSLPKLSWRNEYPIDTSWPGVSL